MAYHVYMKARWITIVETRAFEGRAKSRMTRDEVDSVITRTYMTKKAFNAIRKGLEDAIAYASGDKSKGEKHKVKNEEIDVRTLRNRLGLTQKQFAKLFGVSLATLRNWEQGRRRPEGPAMVLLNVIQREPEAVLRALGYKAA